MEARPAGQLPAPLLRLATQAVAQTTKLAARDIAKPYGSRGVIAARTALWRAFHDAGYSNTAIVEASNFTPSCVLFALRRYPSLAANAPILADACEAAAAAIRLWRAYGGALPPQPASQPSKADAVAEQAERIRKMQEYNARTNRW